jgi:isopenicillin N synthase-like dioxygenase
MESLFASMHDAIAVNVLRAVARNLGCQDKDWFQTNLGPTDGSSQWHVKRYVCPTATDSEKNQNSECDDKGDVEEEIEWLPVHTDPSLISIVLHDVPGKREGAMGLQYQVPDPSISYENDSNPKSLKNIWVDVPWHGHAVATVFVGSVLSYITGNLYPGAKHRVVYRPSTTLNVDESEQRVAATLFVRPRGDCKLLVPPSPLFLTEEGDSSVRIRNTTFDAWLERVSRNYMKGRKKNDKAK